VVLATIGAFIGRVATTFANEIRVSIARMFH
jgi:hypothetical protein